MVAFRKRHIVIYRLADTVHGTLEVTVRDIGRNHDFARHVLTVDGIRTCSGTDFRNLAERHFTAHHIHRHIPDSLYRTPAVVVSLHGQVKNPVAFIDAGHRPACQINFHHISEFRWCDTIFRKHFTLRNYLKLRSFHLLFHIQVHNSRDSGNLCFYLVSDFEHLVQVGTEKLYGNVRPCSGKHRVDTVRDRLADFHIDTRQSPQLVANLLNHSLFRPVGEFKWGFYF